MVKRTYTSGNPEGRSNKNKLGSKLTEPRELPERYIAPTSSTKDEWEAVKETYSDTSYERTHEPKTLDEKHRFKEMMKKVYDAENKYEHHRISKGRRDALIEEAEEEYDKGD